MSGPGQPGFLMEGCCGAFVRQARPGAMVSAKKLSGRLSSNTLGNWESPSSLRTIYDARVLGYAVLREESWNRSNSCLVTSRSKQRRDTSDANNEFERL